MFHTLLTPYKYENTKKIVTFLKHYGVHKIKEQLSSCKLMHNAKNWLWNYIDTIILVLAKNMVAALHTHEIIKKCVHFLTLDGFKY